MATAFIRTIQQILASKFSEEETRSLTRILLEDLGGFPPHLQLMLTEADLSDKLEEDLSQAIGRLMNDEPIQYITGKAHFFGLTFRVTPDVLIPRPETEELVELIINEHQQVGLRIMDIGTGSGCIITSLAAHLNEAKAIGVDVSAAALAVATENARSNNTVVRFIEADVLSPEFTSHFEPESFDLIVSNPPYVLDQEKAAMQANVLSHEPHLALFVPDNDPLLFYRQIAQAAQKLLRPGGSLYFEINQAFGPATQAMLQSLNYQEVTLHQDLFGNDRMIKAKK